MILLAVTKCLQKKTCAHFYYSIRMVSAWLLDMEGTPCAGARDLCPGLPMSSVSRCWTRSLHTSPLSPRCLWGCTSGPWNGHVSEASAVSPQWAQPRPLAWSTGPRHQPRSRPLTDILGCSGNVVLKTARQPTPRVCLPRGCAPHFQKDRLASGRGQNSAFGNTWKIPVKACQK